MSGGGGGGCVEIMRMRMMSVPNRIGAGPPPVGLGFCFPHVKGGGGHKIRETRYAAHGANTVHVVSPHCFYYHTWNL